MDQDRLHKLQKLFESALSLSIDEREKFLLDACGEDSELFDHATALLRADSTESDSLLEKQIPVRDSQFLRSLSLEGKTVGNYQIRKELGSGGMGIVYLAYDSSLNRDVALKFLPPMLAMNESIRVRFTKEAMAAASLNHPNIVTVHEVSTHVNIPYISMEYVDGQTIQSRIRAGDISNDELYELSLQLCDGLAAAHQAGIIHRDIKPGNLMVDSHGRLRILDFGLAKSLDDNTLTKTGSTMGTVEYLSPEQIEGGTPDVRSDLFSLGSVLYELATGVSPFRQTTAVGVLQAITSKAPRPISSINSRVSQSFARIVGRLLEKHPDNRYQSSADVASDLRKIIEGGRVPFQAGQWARRMRLHRSMPAVAALALIAITALAAKIPFSEFFAKEPRIAILQFTNLGSLEDQYFIDGFTTEITVRLSSVAGLQVVKSGALPISSDSSSDARAQLEQLDVDYVLKGSLFWNKDSGSGEVQVVAQLIDARDYSDAWKEDFRKDASELFDIQSLIASSATEAMGLRVQDSQRNAFDQRPTENVEAYSFYLRGLDLYRRGSSWENRLLALELYQRAVNLDSSFALAYARIGEIHSLMYYAHYDHSDQRLVYAKTAIDKSLSIDSESAVAHSVLGLYYYWGFRDYTQAESHFSRALSASPNDAELHNNISLVMRRQGKWEAAAEHLRKAIYIDPLSHQYLSNLAGTLMITRKYAEADTLWDRVIWLSPEWAWAYLKKARLQIAWRGDVDSALAIVEYGRSHARYSTLDLEYVRLLQFAERTDEAKKALTLASVLLNETDEPRDTACYYSILAELSTAESDSLSATAYFDSAFIYFQRIEERTPQHGLRDLLRQSRFHAARGSESQARQLFLEASEQSNVETDSFAKAALWSSGAEIHMLLGDHDTALNYLDKALSIPSMVSVNWIKTNPLWLDMQDHPRMIELLERFNS